MTSPRSEDGRRCVLIGIACTIATWLVFSLHDASIKLLVADLSVWQVLFARSAVIVPICLLAGGRRSTAQALSSPARGRLLLSALVYAVALAVYYAAARHLQLAELETIYYASPAIATLLAVFLLREHVPWLRWAALGLGFAGAVAACRPGSLGLTGSAGLALLAAALWAYAVVLVRQLACAVPTAAQMLLNNAALLVLGGLALPWWWQAPSDAQLALMLAIGAGGALGQYLLYEGIRLAPTSVTASLEYTGLLWAFSLGFAIWGDVPAPAVFVGAGLVMLSGIVVVIMEWPRARKVPPVVALDRDGAPQPSAAIASIG
jgi:drug/metabolite transporter (DMT)-like permease